MRLLDCGCHDGFVSRYLQQQIPGLVCDGIELHAGAVQAARRRLNGVVVQGRAEDAPLLLEPGSYDAAVAFEVIEHVADPGVLLDSLERMVRPGGRVWLSTPDGTFGAGRNPHHLRALRSIDLADMLRRRGRLVEFAVGDDGVSVGCYVPELKGGDIAIYTGESWERWHPADIVTRGLGGSETAAYRLAEALSEEGHVVTLYGNCAEGAVRDVLVRDWRTFDPAEPRLAVISSRIPEIFDRPVNAATTMLWCHDTDYAGRLTERRLERINRVLCLSEWHRRHLAATYPFAAGKLHVTRNGILHRFFQGKPPERERRVLYTSSPDRGLDILLEVWPQVRERVPGATLAHTYAPVYQRIAAARPELAEFHRRIVEMSDQPGVSAIGGLSQPKLATLMRSSMVWAHPSFNTPNDCKFCETSCIGAMEAQAAGCHVVAGRWGALPETVKSGTLIAGDPRSAAWRAKLVDGIVAGLTDPEVAARAQADGPRAAADLDWQGVARSILSPAAVSG